MRVTPACWNVVITRSAMLISPMVSMGLKSPMRDDMPAATISAAVSGRSVRLCMTFPPFP